MGYSRAGFDEIIGRYRRAAEVMGIDWMKRDELSQAVPPANTEFIDTQLLEVGKEQ